MNLYHIPSVRIQCFPRWIFRHSYCLLSASSSVRCTSETILTSADAACRRPVSFLRMMQAVADEDDCPSPLWVHRLTFHRSSVHHRGHGCVFKVGSWYTSSTGEEACVGTLAGALLLPFSLTRHRMSCTGLCGLGSTPHGGRL